MDTPCFTSTSHSSSSLFTTTRVLTSTDRHAVSSCCPSPADLGAAEAYFYRAVHAGDLRRMSPVAIACALSESSACLYLDDAVVCRCDDAARTPRISQRGQLHLCDQLYLLLQLKYRQKTFRFYAHVIFFSIATTASTAITLAVSIYCAACSFVWDSISAFGLFFILTRNAETYGLL